MKKDRRRINKTWQFTNPHGETYLFAKIGSGKNSYLKTLSFLGYNPQLDTRSKANPQPITEG